MSKKIFLLVVFVTVLTGAWFWWTTQDAHTENQVNVDETVTTGAGSEVKTYRNEDWGFQFEYPSNWQVTTPIFGSSVSLFNLGIDPVTQFEAGAITINITPKDWIENALNKMRARGVITEESSVDNRNALKISDKDRLGRPAILTLVLVDDEYWIDITGIIQYEDELDTILASFQFIE